MRVTFSNIRKRAAGALLLLGACLSISGQISPRERAEIFEEVWQTINEKYYDAQFNGVDWRKIGEIYRARIETAGSEREFYALLDRMAGELRDAHTRVYSPEQRAARRRQSRAEVGLKLKRIGGRVVVAGVDPASEAASLGIRPGMIVSIVGGRPVGEAFKEAARQVGVSSSARATEMRVLSKLLAGEPDSVLEIELAKPGQKRRSFSLTRRPAPGAPRVEAFLLPSNIAYLRFDAFDESLENTIGEHLTKFRDAPGLIVDLRANRGGDGETGLRFVSRFFQVPVTVARLKTRTGAPPLPDIPMTLVTEASANFFSRPVAVLIGEETASTAELVANTFQEQRRARLFGTATCGCVLAFLDYKPLKGGGDLSLSEFAFVTPLGRKLEGAGVAPDREIRPRVENLRRGRDAALEAAVEYLKNSAD